VITGRLWQPDGTVARNVQVLAIPVAQIGAVDRFDTRARQFRSDDLGVYRIYGLLPGDYVVAALPAVGVGQVERRSSAEYDAVVRELMGRESRAGATATRTSTPDVAARFGYAPVYHPGTTVATAATPVHVDVGEVRDGVDIPIAMVAMSQIVGTVVVVAGQPTAAVRLSVSTSGPPLPVSVGAAIRLTPPDAQGRFTISNVPPGAYTLLARGGGVTTDGRTITIRNVEQTDWATASLNVNGVDLNGVLLSLQPGLSFSGSVEAAGLGAPRLGGVGVALVAAGASAVSARTSVSDENGSFSVTGLHPDTYEVAVTVPSALSAQWAVRAVAAGGLDLRDRPLTFDSGSVGGVTIQLTERRTEVVGTFSAADGTPATDYFVVLFPEAQVLWHAHSPRVRVVRPAADGSFSARDLPAGAYRMAAVTDVEDDEWRQASFLESLVGISLSVVVEDGQTTRQDIRMR
jgi:hypothetical protein